MDYDGIPTRTFHPGKVFNWVPPEERKEAACRGEYDRQGTHRVDSRRPPAGWGHARPPHTVPEAYGVTSAIPDGRVPQAESHGATAADPHGGQGHQGLPMPNGLVLRKPRGQQQSSPLGQTGPPTLDSHYPSEQSAGIPWQRHPSAAAAAMAPTTTSGLAPSAPVGDVRFLAAQQRNTAPSAGVPFSHDGQAGGGPTGGGAPADGRTSNGSDIVRGIGGWFKVVPGDVGDRPDLTLVPALMTTTVTASLPQSVESPSPPYAGNPPIWK